MGRSRPTLLLSCLVPLMDQAVTTQPLPVSVTALLGRQSHLHQIATQHDNMAEVKGVILQPVTVSKMITGEFVSHFLALNALGKKFITP